MTDMVLAWRRPGPPAPLVYRLVASQQLGNKGAPGGRALQRSMAAGSRPWPGLDPKPYNLWLELQMQARGRACSAAWRRGPDRARPVKP